MLGNLETIFFIDSDVSLMIYLSKRYMPDLPIIYAANLSLENYQELYDQRFLEVFVNDLREECFDKFLFNYEWNFDSKNLDKDLIQKRVEEYQVEVFRNAKKGLVDFSQPFIDEINTLLESIEILNSLKASSDYKNQLGDLKGVTNFTINHKFGFRPKELRDTLVNYRLIDKRTRTDSLRLIFQEKVKRKKINWIGGKDKLAYFLKLLKDRSIINENAIYKIAPYLFLLKEKEFNKISHPKYKDSYKYAELLDSIVTDVFKNRI